MIFSEKLKKLRKDRGITQEELAKNIFVSRTLISKYENGSVYPTKENALKIASYFDVDVNELLEIDNSIELILKREALYIKIDYLLTKIIIIFDLFVLFFLIFPWVNIEGYMVQDPESYVLRHFILSPLELSLKSNSFLILITLGVIIGNLTCSFLKNKFNKLLSLKIINYFLFVISLILIVLSILFVIFNSNNFVVS